jgi:hypothetical protein
MIKERMIEFIDSKGIVKERFYEMIGMTSANFRGPARNSPINSNAIKKMLEKFPDLNLYWLITGEGQMINTSSYNTTTTITDDGSDNSSYSNNKNSGNYTNNYYACSSENDSKILSVKDYEIQSLNNTIQVLGDIIKSLNDIIKNSSNK